MPSPRKTKKAQSSATAKLSAALEFVAPAYKEKPQGLPFPSFCRMGNNQIVTFDGVIALGHPVDEDITICPHFGRLHDSIKRAGDTLNLTELDSGRLSIKGDNLRVIVPCTDPASIPPVMPDIQCAAVDERIREGMAAINGLVKEGDANTRWIETAALLRANTIFATNGTVCLEFFHGIDLPPGLTLPKSALTAVLKTAKPILGFGFSQSTVTFFFEDGAWLKSQMFTEQYPDIDRLLREHIGDRMPQSLPECPAELFAAVAAVAPHSDTSAIYIGPGIVKSHSQADVGADYRVEGLTGYHVISADLMKLIAPHTQRIDLNSSDRSAIFYGDRIRGVIMKMGRTG